jgi:hypothetical protein
MAMTNFVALRDIEKGFAGNVIVAVGIEGSSGLWICKVESQEAERRMLCAEL